MSRLSVLPLAIAAVLAAPAALVAPSATAAELALERALGGGPIDPLVIGDYVYQPTGTILTAIDASDPDAPVITGRTDSTPLAGQIGSIASVGNGYLYAAYSGPSAQSEGFAVYSLADPAHPALVLQVPNVVDRDNATVVAGNGELFLLDSDRGIFRADLANPAAPEFTLVREGFAGFSRGRIEGNLLYAIGRNFFGNYSVSVFDITDPDAPVELGGTSIPGGSFVAAALVPPLVVGVGLGVKIFDVANPAMPVERGAYDDGTTVYYGGTANATHAFGLGNSRLDVFDITDPDTVVPGGQFPIDTYLQQGSRFDGGDLLVATRADRLLRIDIADPAAVALRSTQLIAGGSAPYDIGFNGDHTYILGNDFGIQVADAATLEPQALVEPSIEQVPQSRAYEEMLVDGDRTFLASWGTGVVLLDSSNPAAPAEVGQFALSFATSLAVNGNTLYAGTSTNGGSLIAIDITDPAAPAFLGGVYTAKAMRVRAAGNLVFVADHVFDGAMQSGLRIHDATDPADIQLLSVYDTDCAYASDLVLSEDAKTVYLACDQNLQILDVTDPAAPVRIGLLPISEPWAAQNALAVHGDTAWYGTDTGIVEIDVGDAANPVERQRLPLPGAPRSLRVGPDGKLYAATASSGLFVFEADEPELPPEIFADDFESLPDTN